MTKTTVYKLSGESWEISEDPSVYSSYDLALEAAKEYEGFLGMSLEEALGHEEIIIEEWTSISQLKLMLWRINHNSTPLVGGAFFNSGVP